MARPPTGPSIVDSAAGSDAARQRARLILETIAGTTSVQDAADALGVSPQRFHDLRRDIITATVAACEPKRLGRPTATPAVPDAAARAAAEQARRISDLEVELEISRLREELIASGLGNRLARVKKKPRR